MAVLLTVLQLTGKTKSTARKWVKNNLIFRVGGEQGKLRVTDQFLNESLNVRLPFVLVHSEEEKYSVLANGLNTELGYEDQRLNTLLQTMSQQDLVVSIAKSQKLPFVRLHPF